MRFLLALLLFATTAHAEFRRGADVSDLPRLEAAGAEFTVLGKPIDPMVLMRAKGLGTVRLRLWHSPADGHSGRAEVMQMAARAHGLGLDVLLDFHYSDTWADPGHQTKPAAWQGLSFAAMVDSVRAYTRDVLAAMVAQGTPPAQVQLGNEIGGGMLWPEGRVGGRWEAPQQWDRLAALLKAGVEAVDAVFPDERPEILIHHAEGGDGCGVAWYFDHLVERGVPFDAIGVSYYPWWHGTLDDLSACLAMLAARFGKPVTVVETAYPWTLGWADDTHNPVGMPEHLLDGYPATPQGQRRFLSEMLRRAGDGGVFWWAPESIPAEGVGSSWENCTLFDFEGEALPAWEAWGQVLRNGATEED